MNITRGDFSQPGLITYNGGIQFTFVACDTATEVALVLYDIMSKKEIAVIKMTEEYAFGRVYSVKVSGIHFSQVCYLIKEGESLRLDEYATAIIGRDTWADAGHRIKDDFQVYGGIAPLTTSFKDYPVSIAPCDMVMYKIHIRGFTKGFNMTEDKCNYRGLIAKTAYLKKLGVTSIELMPIYDFEELVLTPKEFLAKNGKKKTSVEHSGRINYWGYGAASYFAPKASYFGGAIEAAAGFRHLVSHFHKNNMEIIMEMSFAEETDPALIIQVLHYYVRYFHVDGFHIIGCNAPAERIVMDPYLARTKLFFESLPDELLQNNHGHKHVFLYNDSYMYVTRQIQNHMNGSMVQYVNHMRRQNSKYGFVNYMSSVTGFSLWDSYSYGEKHNEANGEDNRDGTNYNFSFNHGIEGSTNNKAVNAARFKAMRNAFAALFMSQAVPLIVAADEVACSHGGNNNPYCQDNATGYTLFSSYKNNRLLRQFVAELIAFRKQHTCIRSEQPYAMSDTRHMGIPDLSFHGYEPWSMSIGQEQKAIGILFNGAYAGEKEDVYVCYNFHYDQASLALPLLAPGKRWRLVFNTADYNENYDFSYKSLDNQSTIILPGESISVLVAVVTRSKDA